MKIDSVALKEYESFLLYKLLFDNFAAIAADALLHMPTACHYINETECDVENRA